MSEVIESFRTLLGLKLPVGAVAGKFLKSDANGVVSWADIIPAGTKTIFYQGTAPDGWTRDIATLDDVFLRAVSGAWSGGVKGSWSLSVNDSGHSHSMPDHNHYAGSYYAKLGSDEWSGDSPRNTQYVMRTLSPSEYFSATHRSGDDFYTGSHGTSTYGVPVGGSSGNMTSGYNVGTGAANLSNNHGTDRHKYANVILCTKD